MRIAVLADIHGNLPAFEDALKHVSQQKVDQIILAGDIVNGSPDSKACWSLAMSLGCQKTLVYITWSKTPFFKNRCLTKCSRSKNGSFRKNYSLIPNLRYDLIIFKINRWRNCFGKKRVPSISF